MIDTRRLETPNGGQFPLGVNLHGAGKLESALLRFKSNVQQEDIINEIKRHSFYLKPGGQERTKQALMHNRSKNSTDIE